MRDLISFKLKRLLSITHTRDTDEIGRTHARAVWIPNEFSFEMSSMRHNLINCGVGDKDVVSFVWSNFVKGFFFISIC